MANAELWSKIHAERAALADLVATLSDEQLDQASRCEGWRVRDVIGHVISAAETSPASFFPALVASGFRFNTFTQKGVEKNGGGTAAELAEKVRATTTRTNHPPGPAVAMLGEMVVHGEDIRAPLGVSYQYPPEVIAMAGDFFKSGNLLLGGKRRSTGLTMHATDTGWSTGSGPEVRGPGGSLLSAMTGRKAALADLSGDGLDEFATRF
jgi:uncharacterized protein (TIGR03083 family)